MGWTANPLGNTALPVLLEAPWLHCCVCLMKERLCARTACVWDRAVLKPARALQGAGAVHVQFIVPLVTKLTLKFLVFFFFFSLLVTFHPEEGRDIDFSNKVFLMWYQSMATDCLNDPLHSSA